MAALMIAFSPLAAQTGTQPASPQTSSTMNFVPEQKQNQVLGSNFMGTPVAAKGGEQIGRIADLVFDENGSIELAVIGIGGFLGIGEKDVAVPFNSLKSDIQNNKHVLVIEATKDQLNAAPAYKTLGEQKFKEQIAGWRATAAQHWTQMKERAAKAYEDAKTKLNETRQPSEQPAQPQEQR
jgi:sporulation protein YlmC with PRC-barrel domain